MLSKIRSRLSNRRFWRDSSLLLSANLIVTALGLVRTPVMTWVLPKDEIGMLGVVASWVPFLQLISMSGADSAMYHYMSKGQPWAFIVNLFYRLRWSLLSSAGFLIGAVFWAWKGNGPLAWMFLITAITYPMTIGMGASAGMLGAQERFKGLFWYRIWEMLTDFTGFIPLALSAWWVSKVVTFYAANQFATAVFQAGVSFFLAWQLKKLGTPRMPKADETEMLRYGKHLTAITGIGALQARTDALLVGAFLPLETMADYVIALLVYEQLKRIWSIYLSVRYPPLVRMPLQQRQQKILMEGAIVWLGFTGMGLALAFVVHWLIPIILPPEYSHTPFYIDWLIAVFVIGVPGYFSEVYFRTCQNERRQYVLRITAAIVGVILPAVFISIWQVRGVLLGRFLASLVLSALGIVLFIKEKNYARQL
jgi:O-antigen/teichoic acid export membrane protein